MMVDNYKHKGLRNNLVKTLENKGITDQRVLQAIGNVPRHLFFDEALLKYAYQDNAFPIGEGQTISQPYTVAFQSQHLNVQPGHSVLEIGTGSGYQASILLELGARLFTIERHEALHLKACELLDNLGYHYRGFLGDGSQGLPNLAPFDRIIVTAGAPVVPHELLEQLNVNGILLIPVGDEKDQTMMKFTKVEPNKVLREELGNFQFVPLVREDGWM